MMKILKHNLNRLQDPTQQGRNRADAMSHSELIQTRLSITVADFIGSIPTESTDSGLVYLLPDGALANANFEDLFLAALLVDGRLFMDKNVEGAFRTGVLTTERDLESQIRQLLQEGETSSLFDFNSVFGSQEYTKALSVYQSSAMDSMTGISQETSSRISSIIALAMLAGLPQAEIIRRVNAQLEIMKNKMNRVITTTINQGLNKAVLISIGLAATALGLTGVVRHISALLSTTRPHHASRHNNLYTIIEQELWWAQGANRINCYCIASPVLVSK